MLDDYKDKQSIAYNIMMNEIKNNQIGHAYLIDENNNVDSFNIVLAFVKEILTYKLSSDDGEALRKRIDDGNYPELKIIEPDGMLIKKKQIIDLQQDFSMTAVEGNKRIYIIRDADKMRNETANSMLKFLEEPNEGIIAILMTNNFNNLLSTIVSRTQVIRLNNDGVNNIDDEIDALVLNFIKNIEMNGIKAITKEQELIFSTINTKERDKITNFFDKMILMYYDILKIFSGNNKIKFSKYLDDLTNIVSASNIEKILDKISILLEYKDRIKYNVNINLLVDSLIVNIGGVQ